MISISLCSPLRYAQSLHYAGISHGSLTDRQLVLLGLLMGTKGVHNLIGEVLVLLNKQGVVQAVQQAVNFKLAIGS